MSLTFIINLLRFFSALPFALYFSSLKLYLSGLDFPIEDSSSLVGSVLALSYALSLVGGYLADKYIGLRNFFIFSCLCQAIGCFTFASGNFHSILWLSSFFLLGCAGLTVSLNMILTKCYETQSQKRENGFFWLYMSLNLGYLVGFSLSGYFEKLGAYQQLSSLVFSTSIITIILSIIFWKKLNNKTISKENSFYFVIIASVLFIATRYSLQYSKLTNIILTVAWFSLLLFMLFYLKKDKPDSKRDVVTFYVLLLSALTFWTITLLLPTVFILFIKEHVNLTVLNIKIPPQWLQNISSVIIIGGTILIGWNQRKKPMVDSTFIVIKKFSLGLLLLSASMLTLWLSVISSREGQLIPLAWVFTYYILQSLGELLIGPISYSLIGRFIPKTYQAVMMGIWVTLVGIASAIASKLTFLLPHQQPDSTLLMSEYSSFFFYPSLFALGASFTIYLYAKLGKHQLADLKQSPF